MLISSKLKKKKDKYILLLMKADLNFFSIIYIGFCFPLCFSMVITTKEQPNF